MSAIETVSGSSGNSAQRSLEAALEGIAQATGFYDFENAWITGRRMVSESDGDDARDLVLAAAGRRLRVLGELQDDVARRNWLEQIGSEAEFRGESRLSTDLKAVAAAELREAFARVADDLAELRRSSRAGQGLSEFAARNPRPAGRIRSLGRIAESLRSSGLLSLCDADDCELACGLARVMMPPVHLVPTVPASLRVGREDLLAWAKSGDAAAELPRLVRSLIAETEPSVARIDVPAGTGTASPGWDGLVQCARGNRFVPAGRSVWELTTKQRGTHAKAETDYAKRLRDSTPNERAETAYMSVACAPWTQARAFEAERSSQNDFSRVGALNVDHLEDWLSCAVTTTVWMREQIDKPLTGIRLLSNWWQHWLAATSTPLDEGFVLAGRDEAVTALRDLREQRPGIVTIGGQIHRDEIIAFIAAALGDGDMAGSGAGHVLYVDSHDTAEGLFRQEAVSIPPGPSTCSPVLTMVVPSVDFAKHLPAGSPHQMIVPTPGSPQAAITLSAVDSEAVNERLQAVGFEPYEAHELGSVARTSLMALRRCLAVEPGLAHPELGDRAHRYAAAKVLAAGWLERGSARRQGDCRAAYRRVVQRRLRPAASS